MKRADSYLKRKLNEFGLEEIQLLSIDESDWLLKILGTPQRAIEKFNKSSLILQIPWSLDGFQEEENEM